MNWLGPDQPEGEPVPGPLAEQALRLALVHRAQQPDTRDPRTGHTLEQSFAIRVRWRAAVRTIARLLRLRQRWAALGRLLSAVPSDLWAGLERRGGVLERRQNLGSWLPGLSPAASAAAAAVQPELPWGWARAPERPPWHREYHNPFQGLPRPPPPPRNGNPPR